MKSLEGHGPLVKRYLANVRHWAHLMKPNTKDDSGLVLDNLKVVEHPELGITSIVVGGTEVARVETWYRQHGPEVLVNVQPFLVLSQPDAQPGTVDPRAA